jgi:hypothetical protein
MVRELFPAVNGKRKQIAIHGQKYAVESTYDHSLGCPAGRKNGKVYLRETQCLQPDFPVNNPDEMVFTGDQPGFNAPFGPPDAVKTILIRLFGSHLESNPTAK